MNKGAVLVISEEINFLESKDKTKEKFFEKLYFSFKNINGYSHLEILNKKNL